MNFDVLGNYKAEKIKETDSFYIYVRRKINIGISLIKKKCYI